MTRILLVETASPRRVRRKAEDILAGGQYGSPELTILSGGNAATLRYLEEIPGVRVVPLRTENREWVREELRRGGFHVLYVFWTGEKKYRRMKFFALRLKADATYVDIGDGGEFRLTWKACIRHFQFRLAHPLPTDHWVLVCPPADSVPAEAWEGEKVLIIQSAEPPGVLRALDRLKERPLFRNPRYTLFCRNRPETVRPFLDHPMLHEIRTHSETKGSWTHLRRLRRERFDAVVVFFNGDPSYRKIRCFAFLLGARHKLVFNEYNGCFYFTLGRWLTHVSRRLGEKSRWGQPVFSFRSPLLLTLKALLLPFRFLWLLLVWLRLRGGVWLTEGRRDGRIEGEREVGATCDRFE